MIASKSNEDQPILLAGGFRDGILRLQILRAQVAKPQLIPVERDTGTGEERELPQQNVRRDKVRITPSLEVPGSNPMVNLRDERLPRKGGRSGTEVATETYGE